MYERVVTKQGKYKNKQRIVRVMIDNGGCVQMGAHKQ